MKRSTETKRKLKFLLWSVVSCLLLSMQGYSQTKNVTGYVTTAGATADPVPGATITVKGTKKIATADAQGHFAIEAGSNDVLVVSSVGYTSKEVKVGNNASVNVRLEQAANNLNEVVVVGYGKMKKTDQSSAQVSVSAADISKTVNTTVEQALQGRAAGVYVQQNTGQPGGGISVNIRGINTIGGSNEPLYVIDGVQIQPGTVNYGATASTNPLSGLNPNDIESMEVLQGPSATAIYGSKGTNGVVLITTKRGKSGQLKVGYNYLYSLQDRPDLLPTMTLPQYAEMVNEIYKATGGTPPAAFQDISVLGPGTNWQKELFKTAPLQKHQLTLSGGSNNTNFYLSGEHFNQEGVAIGSNFERNSIRLNLDNQTRKWLKLSANFNFYETKERVGTTSQDVIRNAINTAPNVPVRDPNGGWGGQSDPSNSALVQFTPLNPVAIASLIENNLKKYGGLGGLTAEVNILKGLTFRTSLNGNASWGNGSYFIPTYQLGGKSNSTSSLSLSNSTNTYWNWNQVLQYTTRIASKHDLNLMVGHESQESKWNGISGSRTGFVSNDVLALPLGNAQGQSNSSYQGSSGMESYFSRINYTYNDKYIIQGAFRADGSSNFGPENRWGYFPSVSAAWRISQEPFMRNVTIINDLKLRAETGLTGNSGSSGIYSPLSAVTTPFGTGYVVGTYGNAALKWESTSTIDFGFNLSMLKNRIQLEGDYYVKKTDNLLLPNPLPAYMGTSGEGSIGRPTVNIGALQNHGYGITLNTVNIDKKGFSWRTNFNISGFRTEVTKFYSQTAVINRQPWYIGSGSDAAHGFLEQSAVGRAPWLFIGYIQEGVFQSVDEINKSAVPTQASGARLATDPSGVWVGDIKYKDLNGDGIIDYRDQTVIGNPWPKATIGFTNTFTYKGFDLSALITGSFGNDIYNYVRWQNTNPNNVYLGQNLLSEAFNYAKLTGTGTSTTLVNPGTMIPRIVNGDPNGNFQRFTDAYVEDGSYVRIKNVTLGYNVPKTFLRNQNVVQGARLSIGVQNLATFTKYKGYDPEVAAGAYVGNNVQLNDQLIGVDAGRYPLTRIYTFSLGVDF